MHEENNPAEVNNPNQQHAVTLHPFTKENLRGFSGRMNRLDYAILFFSILLINWFLQNSLGINPLIISIQFMTDPESLSNLSSAHATISVMSLAAYTYISVRRFHDIGYSGFLAVIFLTPLIPLGIFSLLLGFIIFILKMILFFAAGTPTTNQYGDRPNKNHRNKILLLCIVFFALFILYSSFAQEARPLMEGLMEELLNQS